MPAPSELKACRTAEGLLIRVQGRGTMRESPGLRRLTDHCLDRDPPPAIVVDLTVCEYLDSTFLGCLVGLHRRCQQLERPRFWIAADAAGVRRLLGPTKLERVLRCVEEVPQWQGEWIAISAAGLEREDFGRHLLECHRRLVECGGPATAAFQAVCDQLAGELGERPQGASNGGERSG